MKNSLQIFENPEFGTIRTINLNGVPHFVGKDVTNALGYKDSVNALKSHVDPEDKKIVDLNRVANQHPITDAVYSGGWIKNEVTVINESGLYSLILSSNLPNAKKFKRWITSEVLPVIRKYGVYATEDFAKQAIANPQWAIDILSALQTERDKNAVLTQQVAELQPKVDYCDLVLNCKDLINTGKIAKDYGLSARSFNKLLHGLGVQYKQGDIWLLYQKYAKLGWTQTKTYCVPDIDGNGVSKISTCWTQKGRLGLYELLKKRGYLPLIEQNDEPEEVHYFDEDEGKDPYSY